MLENAIGNRITAQEFRELKQQALARLNNELQTIQANIENCRESFDSYTQTLRENGPILTKRMLTEHEEKYYGLDNQRNTIMEAIGQIQSLV